MPEFSSMPKFIACNWSALFNHQTWKAGEMAYWCRCANLWWFPWNPKVRVIRKSAGLWSPFWTKNSWRKSDTGRIFLLAVNKEYAFPFLTGSQAGVERCILSLEMESPILKAALKKIMCSRKASLWCKSEWAETDSGFKYFPRLPLPYSSCIGFLSNKKKKACLHKRNDLLTWLLLLN